MFPDDAGSADELVRFADRALYAEKAAGRNRVEVVEPKGSSFAPEVAPARV